VGPLALAAAVSLRAAARALEEALGPTDTVVLQSEMAKQPVFLPAY
jgi:hypothetical protein